jgi:hypothetical protein
MLLQRSLDALDEMSPLAVVHASAKPVKFSRLHSASALVHASLALPHLRTTLRAIA